MFVAQPNSSFGDLICEELDSEEAGQRQWQTFEFAAAWVNDAGAKRIRESARRFLAEGGRIRATVGLDFSSTSYEGLGSLLDLEDGAADMATFVFFDENPACTFHPKVFLFSNAERARLFVGSNNMTGAGLDTNVEAASGVTGALDDETVLVARQALEEWRDTRREPIRTRRLTRELLERLRERGYVRTEEEIRDHRRSDARSRSSKGEPLFGRSTTRAGRPPRGKGGQGAGGGHAASSASGEVLLMRVRPRRNGNQVQVSKIVLNGPFMNGATEVILTDGSHRRIGSNAAEGRGVEANTERFEAPGLKDMTNPVARFQWVATGGSGSEADRALQFELFDADSGGVGAEIYRKLKEGIAKPPLTNLNRLSREETGLSKSDQESAQWYRLDSV